MGKKEKKSKKSITEMFRLMWVKTHRVDAIAVDNRFNKHPLALRLYLYMLSKPPDFDFNRKRIATEMDVKLRTLDGMIKTLKDYGYLQITKVGNNDFKWKLKDRDNG